MDVYLTARARALNNGCLYHVAAILWRVKTPIALGVNSYKTHPIAQRTYKNGDIAATLHAEMSVLSRARPGDILEVIRFTHTGRAMAKPCVHCLARIPDYVRVRYTDQNGDWQWL